MCHTNHRKLQNCIWFLLDFYIFYHWFKCNDLNQSILTKNSSTFIQIFCAYATSLNANKFITPVPVYKMKYLLKCQYWNCQLVILLTLMAYTHQMLNLWDNIYVSWIKTMWTMTMLIVNSLHISWNLNATFTLCQSTLSNLWHSNSYDLGICKG